MNRTNRENSLILFSLSILPTIAFFLPLYFSCKNNSDSNLYKFFFNGLYIQASSTYLFFVAVIFVVFRYKYLKDEIRVLDKKISIENLQIITPKETVQLLASIPNKYRYAISFHRMGELLNGYLHNEAIYSLNQELYRRELEQIERGHNILTTLRQVIPAIGFLGTVVGLSQGMARFPELAASAGSIGSLKFVLKDFASSLSVAFNTTLLALGYTIVVLLIASLLKRREETFVTEVDEKAKLLISKLRPNGR